MNRLKPFHVLLSVLAALALGGLSATASTAASTAMATSAKVDHNGYTTQVLAQPAATPPSCQYGHLCVYNPSDNTVYDYYKCGTYPTNYLYGAGTFTNNETTGTVAKFYGSSGNLIFSSRAFQQGNINLIPVYKIIPC